MALYTQNKWENQFSQKMFVRSYHIVLIYNVRLTCPWANTYTQTNYIDTLLYHVYETWDMCHICNHCNGPFCVTKCYIFSGKYFWLHPPKRSPTHGHTHLCSSALPKFPQISERKFKKIKKNKINKWQFNGRSPKFETTLKGLMMVQYFLFELAKYVWAAHPTVMNSQPWPSRDPVDSELPSPFERTQFDCRAAPPRWRPWMPWIFRRISRWPVVELPWSSSWVREKWRRISSRWIVAAKVRLRWK